MLIAYRYLTIFFYPILVLIIYFRKILKKEHNKRYKEKIFPSFFNVQKEKSKKLVWFHAASVGEVKSILPIVSELNNKNNLSILITTVTLSSGNLISEEIKKYRNVQHRYFPIDVSFVMKKFLLSWKPDAIFFIDSEIWPNLITLTKQIRIPIAILNARITKKTFARWSIAPETAKKIFSCFDLCLTSNNETKDYLQKFSAKNIFFHGNIKFINNSILKNEYPNDLSLSQSRFWLASSTHNTEEVLCLKTHIKLKEKFKKLITIIAPRHLNRVKDIKTVSESMGLNTSIIDKNDKITDEKEIFIINYFGALPKYFRYAKSVFIGKSTVKKLEDVGGQNPIEAVFCGCKIYHGPYVYNFEEIYDFLQKNKISKKIRNFDDLADNLYLDLKETKKKQNNFLPIINELSNKIFNLTMRDINNFLANENI